MGDKERKPGSGRPKGVVVGGDTLRKLRIIAATDGVGVLDVADKVVDKEFKRRGLKLRPGQVVDLRA